MRNENEQCKDVYAHYGLAMYAAQCLERGISVFLAMPQSPGGPTDVDEFDAMLDGHHRRTLGQLLGKLREWRELPKDQEALLERALDRRNWIAHRYFWDRAGHFMSPEGRDAMIQELQEARHLFDSANSYLQHVTAVWLDDHGITQESLADIERAIIAESDDRCHG